MTVTDGNVTPKTRDAQYELEVVDTLPPKAPRTSALKQKVGEVKANEKYHNKPIRIAHYGQGATASAAANTLRQNFGNKPYVEGFKFETRQFDHDEHGRRIGLFVIYDPTAKEENGWERFNSEREKRAANRAAAKTAKDQKPEATSSAAQNTAKQAEAAKKHNQNKA